MSVPFIPGLPGFGITPPHNAFGTVIAAVVPPFAGPRSAPLVYGAVTVAAGSKPNPVPNWYEQPYTHLTTLLYTTGTTAHAITVMRPLNWTTFAAAVAKNTTAISLTTDPGLYSTSYNYPLPGSQTAPALVADNALAAGDYVAYQLDDGTWQYDTIASGTFSGGNIVLTTGTPNRNGATIAAGRPIFWFGVPADSDPATGQPHPFFDSIASTNKIDQIGGYNGEGIVTLHPGDPMIVESNNVTATGIMDLVAGFFGRY